MDGIKNNTIYTISIQNKNDRFVIHLFGASVGAKINGVKVLVS